MNIDMKGLFEKAKKFKEDLEQAKLALADKKVTVEVGGGMVKVTANGNSRIIKVEIDKSIVNPDEIQMLQDLIVAAVNKAYQEAQQVAQEEISKASGSLPNIPGLNFFT